MASRSLNAPAPVRDRALEAVHRSLVQGKVLRARVAVHPIQAHQEASAEVPIRHGPDLVVRVLDIQDVQAWALRE